ncbi:hypothetical protein MVEN_01844600 [Mycena venus]|uniref:Uncharacterized protein n=1 Tax=Mycena venus TaxID=2733690 RepID=A0A8H6XIL6_9AGAR|nr:hypothetical protein MVEN_01844600 [Mycena venus]
MAISQDPGDPTYRRDIGSGNLVLRWSTAEDKAGCIMLSCLSVMEQEGKESEWAVRFLEPYTDDAFHAGSSTNWAICIDTSPIETPPKTGSDSYTDKMRLAAESAPERVVAAVYFLPSQFTFDGDAVRVPVGKAHILACKAVYRGRGGAENIMNALFEMVNARAHATGCAFMAMAGIPAYYRAHGYEYALNMGRGLVTHVSALNPSSSPASAPSLFSLRPATLDDLPALERFVLAPRTKAEIFTGAKDSATLTAQLRYLLGDRPPAYTSPAYPVDPFFVLEKRDVPDASPRVVAAAGIRLSKPGAPTAVVHPLLWDGVEDAFAVAQAIVRPLVSAVGALPPADGSPNKLVSLRWTLPDAHPLYRWLVAHELAIPTPESSRYDLMHVWWVGIHSLPRFLESLAPVFNARLAGSSQIFGANYAATLHIAAPRAMGGGVVLRIANGSVSVAPANAQQDPKPNLTLPRGALVQLMMGYAGWRELKALYPDVAIEPAVVPLVDVLFPKRSFWSALYI